MNKMQWGQIWRNCKLLLTLIYMCNAVIQMNICIYFCSVSVAFLPILELLFLFLLQEEAVDYRGYQWWDKVDALGRYLLTISGSSITEAQLTEILRLQSQLEDSEKQPIRYFYWSNGWEVWKEKSSTEHVGLSDSTRCVVSTSIGMYFVNPILL